MRRKSLAATLAGVLLSAAACTSVPGTSTTQTPTSTTTSSVPATTSAPATSSAPATASAQVFTARLDAANRSGVSGEATVAVQGSTLVVEIAARGMVPDQMHAQHIHGFPGGRVSTCPPEPPSGIVMAEPQAEESYGPVLVPLEPFPKADASGNVTYTATIQSTSAVPTISVTPLEGREIVLHGLMTGGTYDKSAPVACGTLHVMPGAAAPSAPATGGSTGTSGTGGSTGQGGSGLGY